MIKQYLRLAKLILSVTHNKIDPSVLSHWLGVMKSNVRMPPQADVVIREFYSMSQSIIGARHIIRKHSGNPKFDPMDAVFHVRLCLATKDPEKNFTAAFFKACKPFDINSFPEAGVIRRALQEGIAPPEYNPDTPIMKRLR